MIRRPKTVDARASYTAADALPIKTMLDPDLRRSIRESGRIIPLHVQFIPTNRCNLKCSFCSCSERDKYLEMPLATALAIIEQCRLAGTKACTLTGGGESLLHPRFSEIIDAFHDAKIRIGLVTNGLLLHTVPSPVLDKLTWCRISNGDDRTFDGAYRERLAHIVRAHPGVDWAFSHVVSRTPNFAEVARIITFANEHRFTHVRLVADLFQPGSVPLDWLRKELSRVNVDDERVIYQGRKNPTAGGPCYIGFLKPLIGPDAQISACCGVQYALEPPTRDLPPQLQLGSALNMEVLIARSNVPLDGSICRRCYYSMTNTVLGSMMSTIAHPEFL